MEGASICMDDTKLDAPLPVIGLYITVACAICMVAMGIDTIRGFVENRLWFPCKFFSINATTLALLSVVCKLPMDLSSRMPGRQDQLSKLSGTVFICVSMCFSMPSLAVMTNEQIVTNMPALSIFVITVVVDVCIQLGTGLIYKFRAEHVMVLVCMLLLLGLLCSSAVAMVAAIKKLEEKYDITRLQSMKDMENVKKDMDMDMENVKKDIDKEKYNMNMENVKKDIPKEWVMAHTSNPQYVLARSSLSTAAWALTFLCVLLLLQAEIRSFLMDFCSGQSSYLWATWPVLISQTLSIIVGSVAPFHRWLIAAQMVAQDRGGLRQWRVDYKFERFWVKQLEDWKRNPLCHYFRNSWSKKTAYVLRNMMLDICILLQKVSVQLSNVLLLTSAWLVVLCNKLTRICNLGKSSQNPTTSSNIPTTSNNQPTYNNYVLRLPGENYILLKWTCGDASKDMEQLMEKEWISDDARKDIEQLMGKGKKKKCESLVRLLGKSTESFRNMCLFSHTNVSDIPDSPSDVPLNCWTLPAVTLIAIAVSLSRFKEDRIKEIKNGLSEGLEMMKLVEKHLDNMGLASVRKETQILWSTIDIKGKWLDYDLKNLPNLPINEDDDMWSKIDKNRKWLDLPAPNQHQPTLILRCLAIIGKNQVMHYREELDSETSDRWPPKAMLGNSLYRISMTILNDFTRHKTVEDLLDCIEKVLADIVGKCLSMLPDAISSEYSSAGPTDRERRVRNAVRFLGKADQLFKSPDGFQRQQNVEFTCQGQCKCQEYPGFPCPYSISNDP